MYRRFSVPRSRIRPSRGSRVGFTLVELLVVITIIAMLVGLLIPAVNAARNAGRKAQCMNNQQNLGKAVLNYVTSKEKFPPLFTLQPGTAAATPWAVGWIPQILPMIEQNPLYAQFQNNTLLLQAQQPNQTIQIETLMCPSRNPGDQNSKAPLDYVVNAGAQDNVDRAGEPMDFQENGVFFDEFTPKYAAVKPKLTPPIDLSYLTNHDGTKNTIMLAESTDARDWYQFRVPGTVPNSAEPLQPGTAVSGMSWWNAITWWQPMAGDPVDWGMDGIAPTGQLLNIPEANPGARTDRTSGRPASNHSGGFFVTFCDGHSQFMSQDIEYRVYCLLMSPDSNAAKMRPTAANPATTPVTFPQKWYSGNVVGNPLTAVSEADLNK